MPRAYYNEWNKYAAGWLRELIALGAIPDGDVDERSITDVHPSDLHGYTQCHFFAGVGGWPLAARLAKWPDNRELWTGSPPCQPYSVAGIGLGQDDPRHLWPDLFRLIRARRPAVFMGEQVAAAIGKHWLDGVLTDLEGITYAGRAIVIPACAVNAPQQRKRLWFVAHPNDEQRSIADAVCGVTADATEWREVNGAIAGHRRSYVGDTRCAGLAQRECNSGVLCPMGGEPERQDAPYAGHIDGGMADADRFISGQGSTHDRGSYTRGGQEPRPGLSGCSDGSLAHSNGDGRATASGPGLYDAEYHPESCGAWGEFEWVIGHDGKARRVKPGVRLLAHGVSGRMAVVRSDGKAHWYQRAGALQAFGNAIVPQVAAEVIAAYLDTH